MAHAKQRIINGRFTGADRKVDFQVVSVGPDAAERMLQTQGDESNRPLNRYTVRRYAEDMQAGRFYSENGETIKFDEHGRLIDGQHRLAAVIMSGCAMQFLVARNVPRAAFNTLDIGKTRSAADILSLSGNARSGKYIAAVARVLMTIIHRGSFSGFYERDAYYLSTVSNPAVFDFISSRPRIVETVNAAVKAMKSSASCMVSPKNAALLVYCVEEKNYNSACDFVVAAAYGAGLVRGDPEMAYRSSWMSQRTKMKRGTAFESWASCALLKAWNKRFEGERLFALKTAYGQETMLGARDINTL